MRPEDRKKTELRRWRWRIFAATGLSYACYYFCRKPFYIAKASLGEALDLDATWLGLLGTGYLAAYALGQFVSGGIGNRWGPRLLVLGGMAASAGCNLMFGLVNSRATLALFLVLNGLAQSTGWPGNVGTMANWFHRGERGTVMGFWSTNFQIGGVAANALAAYVLGLAGYRWSFFAGSAVLMAAWVFFLFHQRNRPQDVGLDSVAEPERPGPPGEPGSGASSAFRTNLVILGVFYFFIKFIRYALWSWVPYILNHSYGMAPDQAGYLSAVFDGAGIAGVIAAGALSDRCFGGRRTGISLWFVVALTASCLGLGLFGGSSLLVFGVSLGCIGFFLYGPDALLSGAGAIDVGSARMAALAAGVINGMGSVGAVVQELFLGWLLDRGGVGWVFACLLVSALLAWLCLAVLQARAQAGKADV